MNPLSILDKVLTTNQRKNLKFVGINKALNPRECFTSLERKYYFMLDSMGVYYIPQYPMGGRYYDAYLPDQNILLEFDGVFWHPKANSDCKYGFQRKNMMVDSLKNRMAGEKGIKLIRIREDEPVTPEQMRKLICA
jgi:hypothetical protein